MSLPELIDSMEVAGSVDLRATQVLQLMLDVVGTPSDPQQAAAVQTLQSWVDSGGLRRDPDGDGVYAHSDAIKILDSWWPRAVEAEFKPEMGDGFFDAIKSMMHLDNDPHGDGAHLGSSYIDGWYGYVSKDLRRVLGQSAQDPFSRTYCGGGSLTACRDALRNSLADALAEPASQTYDEDRSTPATDRVAQCPAGKSDQWCWDSIRFRPVGAVTARTIHWINRPTFQQAVEVAGHRPRGYPRPKAATPVSLPLVPAYRACTSPDRTHAGPLNFGSCSSPQLRSDYLTLGTADSNARPTNSVGNMRFAVFPGNPATTTDEADVLVDFSLTDVRNAGSLTDYTGQLLADTAIRITDQDNGGAGGADPATGPEFPFPVTVPCSATSDPAIGGTCAISTSLDAVMPGAIPEGRRAIWELGPITVFDGGGDGVAATGPNTVFAKQGVFVP